MTQQAAKYKPGDRLLLKIGNRPEMSVTVLRSVDRKKPHYTIDWSEHGFNKLLNDVAIPETSFLGLASNES